MLKRRGENEGVELTGVSSPDSLSQIDAAGVSDDMTTPIGKRTTSPAFQFYVNDFLGSPKVQVMTTTEVGAYMLLLLAEWNAGSLPTDHRRLAATTRLKLPAFERLWKGPLGECFYERGGKLYNRRLEEVRRQQADYRKKQQQNASKRWDSHGNATAMPPHQSGTATASEWQCSPTPTPTPSSVQKERVRASLVDQREHRKHAHCGRVCLPAALFGEFMRRRNHLGADQELREWALTVEREWGEGGPKAAMEPGDPFEFWKARYTERWPPAPAAAAEKPKWGGWRPAEA